MRARVYVRVRASVGTIIARGTRFKMKRRSSLSMELKLKNKSNTLNTINTATALISLRGSVQEPFCLSTASVQLINKRPDVDTISDEEPHPLVRIYSAKAKTRRQ